MPTLGSAQKVSVDSRCFFGQGHVIARDNTGLEVFSPLLLLARTDRVDRCYDMQCSRTNLQRQGYNGACLFTLAYRGASGIPPSTPARRSSSVCGQ